ncbi:hypothetical protein LL946_14025 [Knoellia locipacati]
MAPAEVADRLVDTVGLLEVAQVPGALDDDQLGGGDLLGETVRHLEGRAGVGLTPDQQGRNGDPGQQLAEVGLGHDSELEGQRLGPHLARDGRHEVDDVLRRVAREEAGQGRVEVLCWRCEHGAHSLDPTVDLVGRERALPPGIRVHEDERRDEVGMATPTLEHHGPAPRQPGQVDRPEPEVDDDRRERIGEVGEVEAGRDRGRPAHAGFVPGHHGELVTEAGQLWTPAAPVHRGPVSEHDGRS